MIHEHIFTLYIGRKYKRVQNGASTCKIHVLKLQGVCGGRSFFWGGGNVSGKYKQGMRLAKSTNPFREMHVFLGLGIVK